MPPTFDTQKSNINIVPPMSKKDPPPDVRKAVGAATIFPTSTNKPSTSKKGLPGQTKKSLPPVPDDVRKMHASKVKNDVTRTSRAVSPVQTLPQSSEISAPVAEITSQQAPVKTVITTHEEKNKPNTKVSKESATKLQPKEANTTKVSKTNADATPRRDLNKSPRPSTNLKDKSPRGTTKPSTKTKSDNKNSTPKPDETVIDIDNQITDDIPVPEVHVIPPVDSQQRLDEMEELNDQPDQSPGRGEKQPALNEVEVPAKLDELKLQLDNLTKNVEPSNGNAMESEDDFYSPKSEKENVPKGVTVPENQKLDQMLAHKKDEKLSEIVQPSTHESLPRDLSPHMHHHKDTDSSEVPPRSVTPVQATQHVRKQATEHGIASITTTASISSSAQQVMPAVESVAPSDVSKSVADTHIDTIKEDEYSYTDSFTSESEVELPSTPPPKPPKQFLFDPEPTLGIIKMPLLHGSNADSFLHHDDEPQEESTQIISPHKQAYSRYGKTSAMKREESRLLTSSYGTRQDDMVKVYNPSLAKKNVDPKIKELENKKREKERMELERMRKSRMNAMKGVYGHMSPKKPAKKK
ncbi:hypothetical protein ACF0H5_008183 [Mactra antiquata]